MRTRIAALLIAAAGIAAGTAAPASATTVATENGEQSCTAVIDQPCVWSEKNGSGIVGVARVAGADPSRPTLVRVEVKTQRAWGSPWVTVASSTTVQYGSARATTPRVATDLLTMICATGGPALNAAEQTTVCTNPF
ncbi:hypothetical protein ACWGB8_28435 [Kitasatospora sp. NPDC054939]